MGLSNLQGPSAYDSDFEINGHLERLDMYIVSLVRTKIPRNVVPPEVLADEIEDLIQKVRIKLWLRLRKQYIDNLRAYIRCIVYTEVIDLVRRYRSMHSLPLDEDGEMYQGSLMFAPSEGMQDPGDEVEQAEELDDYMQGISEAILQLPPRQRYAMICSLKEQLDDVLPIMNTLREQLTEIDAINWPVEKNEIQSLRASLSVARKKLQSLKRRY